MTTQSLVGMWVTADGYIRHELLLNGRYDEARGSKRSAYQGRYVITSNHIDYVDDIASRPMATSLTACCTTPA